MIALRPAIRHHYEKQIKLPIKLPHPFPQYGSFNYAKISSKYMLSIRVSNDMWLQHFRDPLFISSHSKCTIWVRENTFLLSCKYKIVIYIETYIGLSTRACGGYANMSNKGQGSAWFLLLFIIYLSGVCFHPWVRSAGKASHLYIVHIILLQMNYLCDLCDCCLERFQWHLVHFIKSYFHVLYGMSEAIKPAITKMICCTKLIGRQVFIFHRVILFSPLFFL